MNRSDGDEIPVFTGLPAPEYMQSVLVLSARLKNKKYCVEELDERHVCQGIMIGIMTGHVGDHVESIEAFRCFV